LRKLIGDYQPLQRQPADALDQHPKPKPWSSIRQGVGRRPLHATPSHRAHKSQ
jgi:hypothetical protein